jgi:hypothetical protein
MTFEEKLRAAIKQDYENFKTHEALKKAVLEADDHLTKCKKILEEYERLNNAWFVTQSEKMFGEFRDSVIRELEA